MIISDNIEDYIQYKTVYKGYEDIQDSSTKIFEDIGKYYNNCIKIKELEILKIKEKIKNLNGTYINSLCGY